MITTTGGTGLSEAQAEFLGFKTPFPDEFLLKIEDFFIRPWRNEFLTDFLTVPQQIFEALYRTALKIKEIPSYDKSPDIFLKYIDGLLSLLPKDIRDLNDLDEYDHRRLLKGMMDVWRYNGTATGYLKLLEMFSSRPVKVLQWPYWKTILDEDYLSYNNDTLDSWILSDSNSYPDTYWTHLRVVDEGFRTLNRRLIEDLVRLNMNVTEWVTIRWLYFLDTSENLEQFYLLDGSGGFPRANLGNLEFKVDNFLRSDVLYDDYWTDYSVKVTHQQPAGSSFRICFLLQDINNYYSLNLTPDTGSVSLGRTLLGSDSTLATFTVSQFYPDVEYTWNVEFDSSTGKISVYQDGILLGSNTPTLSWTQGRIGLYCDNTSASADIVKVDEVEVYKIYDELDSSSSEYGKALITRLGPQLKMYPGVTTVETSGTKTLKILGGFGDFSISAVSGTVSVPTLSESIYQSTYTAPGSPTVDTVTVQDKYGNTATAQITVI